MKTNNTKHLFVIIALVLLIIFVPEQFGSRGWIILMLVLGLLFAFSLSIRKNLAFKGYFTSKINFLTIKSEMVQDFDLPRELLMEKMHEALKNTKFEILHADSQSGFIFASSSISWYSWGENIYIEMEEKGQKTSVKITSACLMQLYDWGKNKKNIQLILSQFEKSLTT